MPRRKKRAIPEDRIFRIYPVEGVTIPGIRAVEQDVTEARWLVLDEYKPPAFTKDPLPSVEDQPPKEGEN